MIPHRSTALLTIIVFVALLLIIFSSSPATNSAVSGPARFVPHPKLPSFNDLHLPSFRPTVHTPPEPQPNSTSGETSWFSDWSWINPFSSSITLDENRSVLPPLRDRPFIYTYYEPNKGNDVEENNADAQLLLAWRRAWYAQGFRPVILGRGEAMNNQFYELVQHVKFKPELESEIFKWLAWGHMGDGLLADWHCFPMARYDDALLSSLRRGSDPAFITRFDRLGGALYSGEKSLINEVIKQALNKVDETSTSLVGLASTDLFKVDGANSLALYDSSTITSHYPTIAEKIVSSPTAGRLALAELINSHLHNTFQNAFPAGIAILKPFPKHTTALVEPALRLAKALVQCPSSPVPQSCPPNLPKCHPCDPAKPMQLSQPATYRNTTRVFTVGTLPHPFTLISLQQDSTDVSIRHIRRETDRDVWLTEVTKDQLGLEIGGLPRSTVFKRAVADDAVVGTSLWMTVESLPSHAGQSLPTELLDEFEWQFGFKIPRDGKVDAKNEDEKKESVQHATPSEQGVPKEYEIIQQAREIIKAQKPNNRPNPKAAAEAWNLADSEVWRFVRAYRARSVVERKKWEEDEKDFVGAQLKQ